MALSSKALQQKRAKKSAKRKQLKKSSPNASAKSGLPPEWLAADAPIADVYIPEKLFEIGIGSVWFSRQLEDGRYSMSAFLVDTFCLGVKNAFYSILSPEQYRQEINNFRENSGEDFVTCEPEYARKLVEMAAAYALELGIEPHADYTIAKMIFGDVDASRCDANFQFGRDGKPLYIPVPSDNLSVQRRIMKQLEKHGKDPVGLLINEYLQEVEDVRLG